MSSLSRLSSFNNSATTYVVLAASNKLTAKPMIPLSAADDHHHEVHISLPNHFKPSSSTSLGKLLARGSLSVTNSFTSNSNSTVIKKCLQRSFNLL